MRYGTSFYNEGKGGMLLHPHKNINKWVLYKLYSCVRGGGLKRGGLPGPTIAKKRSVGSGHTTIAREKEGKLY